MGGKKNGKVERERSRCIYKCRKRRIQSECILGVILDNMNIAGRTTGRRAGGGVRLYMVVFFPGRYFYHKQSNRHTQYNKHTFFGVLLVLKKI